MRIRTFFIFCEENILHQTTIQRVRENQNNFFINCIILLIHQHAIRMHFCVICGFFFRDSTSPTEDLESEISQRMENVTTIG